MHTVHYVASFMNRIIRYPKDIIMKRLQRQKRRKTVCTQKKKEDGSKCTCSKCIGYRTSQQKRVIEPDFFANLAYQHRISKQEEISPGKDIITNSSCQDVTDPDNCKTTSDHRDVQISSCTGWSYWTNGKQRYMPPLYHPCRIPSKSECSSSMSGYRSATPTADSLNESLKIRKNASETSIVTHNRSVVEIAIYKRKKQNRSKSDSRFILRRNKKNSTKRLTRSASTKTASFKKKKRSKRLFNVGRNRSKDTSSRKISKVTSHTSLNNFSTRVCCSRSIINLK
ncbi:uncharacterized protein LOC117167484 isoform X2 [Belonocnema kinseyi]|nr:uncharacterized protein LOC117167484 isoform X2 [Belonocnema kinseyi]